MKPFLLLQQRPEDETSDNEYEAFWSLSGLKPAQLERIRVDLGQSAPDDLENYSGVILGGGPYNVSDPESRKSSEQIKSEAILAKTMTNIIEQDIPCLVACGIGTPIISAGGVMSRKYGEPLGAVEMTVTGKGKKDRLTKDLGDKFRAYAGHKEACEILPKNAVTLISSANCPNQLIRLKENIYLCQFHPELDAKGLEIRTQAYKHMGYFPVEEADIIIKTLGSLKIDEPVKILRNFVKIYQN